MVSRMEGCEAALGRGLQRLYDSRLQRHVAHQPSKQDLRATPAEDSSDHSPEFGRSNFDRHEQDPTGRGTQ